MAAERSIVVYGAGAVGGYVGGRLAAAGAPVTLVGRAPLVDAAAHRGLVLRERDGELVTHPAAVTSSRDLPPSDLVILAVRAFDAAASIPDLRPLLGETGVLVAMQNGVGTEERLAAALGPERVLAGALTVSVEMPRPGIITRTSRSGGIALATMSGQAVPAWIVQLFQSTGLPTLVLDDYRSLRWSKLALNLLTAAASAILDMDVAALMAHPQLFRMEQLAVRETGRAMDAQGIATTALPGYPVPLLRLAMRWPRPLAQRVIAPRVVGARSGHSPGARGDMQRGRSEIPWLNGAVAEAAQRLGQRAPVNTALAELAAELTAHPERRAEYRGRPDRLLAYLREHGVRL